jgi:hypothetical protein
VVANAAVDFIIFQAVICAISGTGLSATSPALVAGPVIEAAVSNPVFRIQERLFIGLVLN